MMANKLAAYIITPDKVLYEGEVEAISSVNGKGEFDILPLHENFISIIKDKIVLHHDLGKDFKEIQIKEGVLKIKNDTINVFVGFEVLSSVSSPV